MLAECASRIVARIRSILGPDRGQLQELERMLAGKDKRWRDLALINSPEALLFRGKGEKPFLLEQAEAHEWDEFTCLNSLRDVEATVNLLLWDDFMPAQANESGPVTTPTGVVNNA
jgi:hypothetical protein